jgi:hypothetical protein
VCRGGWAWGEKGKTVERESFSALVTGNCKRLVIKTVALT